MSNTHTHTLTLTHTHTHTLFPYHGPSAVQPPDLTLRIKARCLCADQYTTIYMSRTTLIRSHTHTLTLTHTHTHTLFPYHGPSAVQPPDLTLRIKASGLC